MFTAPSILLFGMVVERLKQEGTSNSSGDLLETWVNMGFQNHVVNYLQNLWATKINTKIQQSSCGLCTITL